MASWSCWTHAALEQAALESMLGEINALKPGNVHRFAGGHGMRYEDFLISAQVTAPILCRPDFSLGQRCLEAVRATREAVGTNTNLGLVLLFAPIICAAQHSRDATELPSRLLDLIRSAGHDDTVLIYRAIAHAQPGGLGQAPAHDVHSEPDCSLFEAMSAAAERDSIARQYSRGFIDLFSLGLPALGGYVQRGIGVECAAVGCYLRFLACFPDSHIRRKHGLKVALQVSRRADATLAELEQNKDPGTKTSLLLGLDREWKESGINPGTSADLTAGSLLLYHLGVEGRG